ncbi:MAG TPA: DMT family transporter [Candidatus Eubacterium faecipullorum]|uniref:DMT family transporter n=1 Tax=Candidatus Eubacterium faecipullorum TaxID=2838571 RepID=A0A9D1UGI0_9FIRM|nr:DMT family transporter [Candidatus Eubacterium faecipullorum]
MLSKFDSLSSKTKGVIFIVLSALSFTGMNTFVRLAGDLPTMQKVFFRNFVAMVFAFFAMLKAGDSFKPKKGSVKYLLLRSAAGLAGVFGNFYALDKIELSDASMLNKMSPFFALVFSALFIKEKVKPKQAIAIAVAFIGSLFIIKPTFANTDLFASLAGFAGGMAAGGAYTCVRWLGIKGENGRLIVLFFSVFSCILTVPYLIFDYHYMTAFQWFSLLMAGLFAAGGQFAITAAYTHAPSREISVYDYSQIIFAAIVGFFVFGDVPDLWSFVGYIIIISMAVWMFLYNNRNHALKNHG